MLGKHAVSLRVIFFFLTLPCFTPFRNTVDIYCVLDLTAVLTSVVES